MRSQISEQKNENNFSSMTNVPLFTLDRPCPWLGRSFIASSLTVPKHKINRKSMIMTSTSPASSSPKLAALGFCGADDSVNHRHLIQIGKSYPSVEWGILFRPDKEGQPRYATRQWVCRLAELLAQRGEATAANASPAIRLAAHL
eukprot:scaffold16143_cov106-Skeletonema_menzelii.AAC.1